MLFRQGDIFIETVPVIPRSALRQPDCVLAEGELTGHMHRVDDPTSAIVFQYRGQSYLQVVAPRARVVHDEHREIVLQRGSYRFWRQREYDPGRSSADARSRLVAD